jgi:transposase
MLYSKFNLEEAIAVSNEELKETFAEKALLQGWSIEAVSKFFELDEKTVTEIKNSLPKQ